MIFKQEFAIILRNFIIAFYYKTRFQSFYKHDLYALWWVSTIHSNLQQCIFLVNLFVVVLQKIKNTSLHNDIEELFE